MKNGKDYKKALDKMIWWVNETRENVECPPGSYVAPGEGTRTRPNRCGGYDYGSECCRKCWLRWALSANARSHFPSDSEVK